MELKILELCREDSRFAYEAYEFVSDAVTYTMTRLGRIPNRHEQEHPKTRRVAPVDAAGIGGREAVSEASRGRQTLRRDCSALSTQQRRIRRGRLATVGGAAEGACQCDERGKGRNSDSTDAEGRA